MRIVVDAMGGDNVPGPMIEGSIAALRELKLTEIILVGDKSILQNTLALQKANALPITIEHSTDIIGMDESPAIGIKTKPNASIVVAARLVKEKRADGLVSAGNTGATMAASLIALKRLTGIIRPAIAVTIPTLEGPSLLLDAGANVDCKPQHLSQFAIMGYVYANAILGKKNPTIGLLSIGEESTKGNELTSNAFELLEKLDLNFVGNVEGNEIISGKVDVIVCDGFVGNVILKFGESFSKMIMDYFKRELSSNLRLSIGAYLAKPAFVKFKKMVDYSEYGGAPLLGVNGTCIICHGRSSAKAIKNGIRIASEFVNHKVNRHIEEYVSNRSRGSRFKD